MKKSILLSIILLIILSSANASPQIIWSTFLGGNDEDETTALKVDSVGNSFITGYTTSTDFPISTGAYNDTLFEHNGKYFITKLNPNGSNIIFSTFIGPDSSNDFDFEYIDIAFDKFGNSYTTGRSMGNYPVTAGAFDSNVSYQYSFYFISKLNSSGTALIYSTIIDPHKPDEGEPVSIDLDTNRNAFITGSTVSESYPVTPGAYDTIFDKGIYNKYSDAIITKLNSTGTDLVYSTFLGGSSYEWGNDIRVDTVGNAYIVGWTNSHDFPVTKNAFQKSNNSKEHAGSNSFLTKLNKNGSALIFSTYLGGDSTDIASSFAIDDKENPYIVGYTESNNFPTTSGSYDETYNGRFSDLHIYNDVYITKFNSKADSLIYSTFLGGTHDDGASKIIIDKDLNAYLIGGTSSNDFPLTKDALYSNYLKYIYNPLYFVSRINFMTIINAKGNDLIYSSYLPWDVDSLNSAQEWVNSLCGWYDIDIDKNKSIYLTGYTTYADHPITQGAFQTRKKDGADAFVTKFSFCNGIPVIQSNNKLSLPYLLCNGQKDTSIIIHNSGDCILKITAATFSGKDSASFKIIDTNSVPLYINQGEFAKLAIRYTAKDNLGIKNAILNIINNSTVTPYKINLTAYNNKIALNINNSDSDTIFIDLGTFCPDSGSIDTTITIFNKSSIGTTFHIENVDPQIQIIGIDKAGKKEGDVPMGNEKKKTP